MICFPFAAAFFDAQETAINNQQPDDYEGPTIQPAAEHDISIFILLRVVIASTLDPRTIEGDRSTSGFVKDSVHAMLKYHSSLPLHPAKPQRS